MGIIEKRKKNFKKLMKIFNVNKTIFLTIVKMEMIFKIKLELKKYILINIFFLFMSLL